ncbi:MAG: IS4 family transposase [Candidatus Pacebacteria bacterium]|nr:IS4 family transposase [Candidatus Paceibacterota bacterium]
MNTGKLVFAQVMDFLPLHEFRKCVKRYQGNYKVKDFSCLDQFLCMAFAQLTYRSSLRDIETCLRSMKNKLYHMGIRSQVSRNTLSNANNMRDWRIYADFAQVLIHSARDLYINEDFGVDLKNTVYALDASTIDLCLSVFPWARFRKTKAGIKLHTLLDLRGNIPTFIEITEARLHDVNILDILVAEPDACYIMDRGYLDFARLYALRLCGSFFLIRAKRNFQFRRVYSHEIDKSTGLQCDQTIVLTNSFKDYPEQLRRIRFFDSENNKLLIFLTNDFSLPALTVAQLYKCRWQVELFFKWIKQHLRIKSFFGTSENSVKTQIWIAVSIYVLVAIIKKRLDIQHSLYAILQVLSVTLFEKTPLIELLTDAKKFNQSDSQELQLTLFND